MNRKQRHLCYEGIVMLFVALGLVFIIPTMMNEHDSIALLAAGLLGIGFLGWVVFFATRISRIFK